MAAKKNTNPSDAALLELRAFGLAYPGAHTKSPWPGHLDLAVADKTFAYLSLEGEPLSISCKLPHSCEDALMLPGAKPTAYGLGKWGWVSIGFEAGAEIPMEMLKRWIDESYRSQAPKRLLARAAPRDEVPRAGAPSARPAATKETTRKKATRKKAARKRA